jgi:hypothetical protein
MTHRHLAAALLAVVLAACSAEHTSDGTSGGSTRTYPAASWTADASNVDCVNDDRMISAQLAWTDRDGDGVIASPGDLEETIVCTWWCAEYEGAAPIALGVFFAKRDGAWTPVLIAPGPQQCSAR